jgi:hypothetical protein
MDRREKSISKLSSLGLKAPNSSTLPIFLTDGFSVRPLDSVVDRAIAVYLTATYADVLLQQRCSRDEAFTFVNKFIQRYQADSLFSGREKAFFAISEPTTCQIGKFCWGWESLHFLLWALGFIGDVGLPTEPVALPKCSKVFNQNRFRQNLLDKASLQTVDEIGDLLDFVQCCEYVNKNSDDEEGKFDNGAVHGWKKAAQWLLIREGEELDWDRIP